MDVTKQMSSLQKFQTLGDSSCENELEELMHQIDIMVNSKKVEWEKQVLVLERELSTIRGALDQKDREIEVLSKKLEEADKHQQEVVQKYETQLEALKNQLCHLKKSYDKLHYYYGKNHKRDSVGVSPDHEKSNSELRWLTQKLEEYKDQARQWENQRLLYQNNIKMLNEQRKNLLEKCDHLQKQWQSYEEQFSGRTQLQDQEITNNQSEIRRLRCQLNASQETIGSGRVIIENLKTTVKEITLSRNALKAENQNLLRELRDCQKRCQRMENKLSEATIERQAQEDLSRAAELDQRQLHMFILQNSQENTFSSQDLDKIMKEQVPNKEKVQKRLKLSPCKQDQAEKESSIKESRNAGFERLQADVSDLTEKLHQKDITIATISQKVFRLERELDMKEHGNMRQEALNSAEESYYCPHVTRDCEMEGNLKTCPEGHEPEDPEPGMTKPVTWQREITGKRSQEKQHRSSEEDQPDMMADDDTNNNLSCYQPCDSLLVDQECLDFILPKLRSPTRNDQFPQMDFTDFPSFLVCDQSGDATAVPGTEESFISAAERFLQEENRRALDFENILNSHIEELQRYSEHTVKRYTSHSDRHPASS